MQILRTAKKANVGPGSINIKTNNSLGICMKGYGQKCFPS